MWYKKITMPFYEEDNGANIAGANAGEAADLQNYNLENSDDVDNTGASDDNSGTAYQKQTQSEEDNAKFAAARRQAEKERDNIKQKATRDRDIAKKYGKDYGVFCEEDIAEQYGKDGINTLKDLENAILQQSYKDQGIDPDLINKAIESHPVVKQAGQYVNQLQEQQRQQKINEDIAALHKDFPETANIKTVDDLYNLPEWNEIYSYIERGYDMPDAYYKVNKGKVSSTIAKNVQQRTIADIQDRSRRGVVSSNEIDNDTATPNLSEFGSGLAAACGVNPKNVAKRIKDKLKGA